MKNQQTRRGVQDRVVMRLAVWVVVAAGAMVVLVVADLMWVVAQ